MSEEDQDSSIQVNEKYSEEVDVKAWHSIGYNIHFYGHPLQEAITRNSITTDELLARYNFLLAAYKDALLFFNEK